MERKKIIIILLIVFLGFSVIFLPGFSRFQKLREKNEQLLKRISLLEENNDKLKEDLLKMKQDPGYVEKKAREKLGIIKKGEIVYRK